MAELTKKAGSASRREQGPAKWRRSPRGKRTHEQPMASDGNAKSQHRKAEGGGLVLNTARFRARDLAKPGEAQGGSLGTRHEADVSPDMSNFPEMKLIHDYIKSYKL